jgi:hypothetical protein
VQADFEPFDVDVDLELRTAGGTVLDSSQTALGAEVTQAVSASSGGTFLVRAFPGLSGAGVSGYRLLLQDLDLERLKGGRTTPRKSVPGVPDAVEFFVLPEKVGARTKLVLRSIAGKKGSVNDLRVVSPTGLVAAEPGTGRTKRGTKLVLDLAESGTWRIEVAPRDGTSGRYTIQAKVRRR